MTEVWMSCGEWTLSWEEFASLCGATYLLRRSIDSDQLLRQAFDVDRAKQAVNQVLFIQILRIKHLSDSPEIGLVDLLPLAQRSDAFKPID